MRRFLASLSLTLPTDFHPPDPPSFPIYRTEAEVDQAILRQVAYIRDILYRKNSLVPISRLPHGILAAIFIHYAHDYYQEHSSCNRVADWVNVSYVCHHWRNVALGCPTLWTYHFSVSLRWTEELLVRSGPAALKIHLAFQPRPHRGNFVKRVMDHAERIQELRLELPNHLLPTDFFLCAPRLRTLAVATTTHGTHWSPTHFGGETPVLHTLDLYGCGVQWHSLVSSKLTTLSLRNVPPCSRQSLVEFRAILTRMPNLTDLRLDDALTDSRDLLSDEPFSTINLPHLLRLILVAPFSTVVALLSCIGIPLKTHVTLEFQCENSPISDYAPIPHLLAQRFGVPKDPALSSPPIHSMFIHFAPDRLRLVFTTSESVVYDADTPLDVTFVVGEWLLKKNGACIISDICRAMPLTNLHSLHVRGPPSSSTFWKEILGQQLSGLQRIKLSKGMMPDILSILGARRLVENSDGRGGGSTREHEFVPALEKLELECIEFSSHGASSQSALFDALSSREALRDRVIITEGEED